MTRIDRLFGSLPPELDCGEPVQNEFLRTAAVYAQNEGISATHLAYSELDKVVGFVTLAMASVRFEAHERPRGASVSTLPALLVAQLGVAKDQHGRGIGTLLIRFATGIAQSLRHSIGCRYLVVDCSPAMAAYYERLGFRESKGEKRQRKASIERTGGRSKDPPVRLALDVATGAWHEVDVAPPHLYATELHKAAGEGDVELLTSLLRAGVPADIRSGRGDDGLGVGATPLHAAAARAEVAAIRALLAKGADINASDGDGEAPLHWAVRHNQLISVAALLVAGADPHLEGGNGSLSPLAYALNPSRGRSQIADLLQKVGAVSTCEGEPYTSHWLDDDAPLKD